MSQEANNWAHTSERGNAATVLAGVGRTAGPTVVNSAELRPYQSGRLGLDSEMGVGINHHGPNGRYPTREISVSDPHQLPNTQKHNVMNKTGGNEIAIPVTSGPTGTALLVNHPHHTTSGTMDRNHDGIPDSQQHMQHRTTAGAPIASMTSGQSSHLPQSLDKNRDGHIDALQRDRNHDGIPDSQQHQTMGQILKNVLPRTNKDKNHDGISDNQQRDRNHDGIPDNQQHQTMGQKIAGLFGGNKDKNHDGIPDNQQHGVHHTTTGSHTSTIGMGATHHADTVEVSNKPTADVWIPKQFGRMPPGSTIKDPAHHPGFATHVVTENIPVTDELGREATITKQTVITTQDTIIGLLHRDHDLINSLFQRWFATHGQDLQQRESLWYEIEHELLSSHAGHTGILHSSYNKHLTKDDGYDHSGSFRGYNDMHTLTTDMSKLSVREPTFEMKMKQLYGMYQNYYNEHRRYLPLMEKKMNNQQLIDMGTAYNLKKSGVKNTRHSNRLETENKNKHATTTGTSHHLHEHDREHTQMASKHADRNHDGIPDNQQHKTMGQKIAGVFGGNKDKNHDGIPDNQQRGANTSTYSNNRCT